MQDFQPISVLMPVKNGERFLSRSIKSLKENYSPGDEIIIVNDNSTDKTLQILESFALSEFNVIIANNSKNGLVAALNLGLSLASNEWIARFDVDDQYPSNRLALTRPHLANEVVGVFSDYSFMSDNGKFLGIMPSAISSRNTYTSLISSQRTAHPSVCFNKNAVMSVGGYLNEDFPAEDISLWLRLTKIGCLKSIPLNLLNYRINPKSISNTMRLESIKKKNQLVDNYSFNQSKVDECLDNLMNTKFFYSEYSLGSERYLLHLRDLMLILKSNRNKNRNMMKFLYKKIYLDIENINPGEKLLREMILRRIYRFI
jgi:glycosyltransferase involved in cell wall biosynthesis